MILRSDTILDQYNRPVPGAKVYVYNIDGSVATLTIDGTTPITQGYVSTDDFGTYSYYANAGYYTEETWFGGKKLWVQANIAIGSPGADLALRADLYAATGATLIHTSSGETVEAISLRPRRLTLLAPKSRANKRTDALTQSRDLTYMKGWAKNAGTTGGAGKVVLWVTRSSDDPNTPGTLRYAMNRATTLGGGQIIVDPRGELDIILTSRLDVPANTTIDAPGRNCRIRANSGVAIFNIPTQNVIIRRLELSHLIDPTGINNKEPYYYETLTLAGNAVTMIGGVHNTGSPSTTELVELTPSAGSTDTIQNLNGAVNGQKVAIRPTSDSYTITVGNSGNINTTATLVGRSQYLLLTYSTGTSKWTVTADFNTGLEGTSISAALDAGGYAAQADAITVVPTTADKIWFDELTIQHVSDGAIDVSSSALTVGSGGPCRLSVSRCIIRDQYKSMLCGSASLAGGDILYTNARKVFASYYENWYDHSAERHPRTAALGYSDSVNNIYDLSGVETDDGVATGSYGIASLYGGWVRTRGDLFRSLDGVASLAVQCSDGSGGIAESAAINENSVVEGSLTIQTRNTGTPAALPGSNYDLTPAAVPTAGAAREAWRASIQAAAGARIEAMPRGNWIYSASSTAAINGVTVRAALDRGGGRYLLDEAQQELVPQPEALSGATTAAIWTRGSTKTLATDVLTIDGTATVWAVNPESGSADNIVTINGMADNQLAIIRPAGASDVLTVLGTGNISLPSSGIFILNGNKESMLVRYDAGIGKVVVVSQPSGAKLSATATYDPPSIAAGGTATTTVAVTNAALGDVFTASFSLSLAGLNLTAYVSVAGTVTAVFSNPTAGAIDLASGTLKVAKVA